MIIDLVLLPIFFEIRSH